MLKKNPIIKVNEQQKPEEVILPEDGNEFDCAKNKHEDYDNSIEDELIAPVASLNASPLFILRS